MRRPAMGGIQAWRAFLRLPVRLQVWQPKKIVLCPKRPPKRPRGGVVASKVVVSAYSRPRNLMGRPVMGGIQAWRAFLRLPERLQVTFMHDLMLLVSLARSRSRSLEVQNLHRF